MKRKVETFLQDAAVAHFASAPKAKVRTQTRPAVPAMATRSIQLDRREQQLRELLLDVAASIDSDSDSSVAGAKKPVVLRWAGGWVRDKLLGIASHDIDVAINTMTGVAFAQRMRDYCDTPEAIHKHTLNPSDMGNLHNVAANPDRSKHLETAMVKVFGLDLDFVNLRKETYAQDSRNPQMEFGTPEEDALRRDATINALFYNLHSDCIEDFTGGLSDLDTGLIRTPMEPLQTFTDDPLRVLRLVRFASRLQFAIDPMTRQSMSDKQVLDSLVVKISRERVGVELEKMLRGDHPLSALELIDSLQLYHAIFTDPARTGKPQPDIARWHVVYECLDHLMQNPSPQSIRHVLVRTDEAAYIAWNLAALSPWLTVDEPPDVRRKFNALPPVAVIAREGFKAPNKLVDVIAASYRHRREILELKKAVYTKQPFIWERDRFGMAIRRWETQGGSWRLQVLCALLVEALETLSRWKTLDDQARNDFTNGWQAFLDHLTELDVQDAPSLKRLLDGRSLAAALGIKPGKWTGQALEVCTAWQLRNPDESDPAGAIEEVRRRSDELEIPLT